MSKITTFEQLENAMERVDNKFIAKGAPIEVELADYLKKSEASDTYLSKTAFNVIGAVPVQNGTITYDGTAKTPSWLHYDTSKLQISGDYQNKTNVGTYPVGFKPISPYTWSNGTQELKNGTWAIGKAAGSLSLSAESGSVNIDATSTFTVNRAGDGVITVTSSNSNVASVSVSGNTVTITGKAAGSATITVKVAEGTNHFAPANKTFAVTVTKIPLNLSASISGAVTYNTTGTITLNSNSGGGAVTATSANDSCVTVSNTTASTVRVKCTNCSAATTQITINVAETTKYTSGTTTCNVTTTKAEPTLTLSSNAVTPTSSNPTATVTVTTNSTGALSATPNNAYSCSATVNDNTVSIKALSHDTAFVTVTVAETNNFLAISKNISVDTRNAPINMLEGRTLAQLKTLIQSGQAPNLFQVGDYFDITFPTKIELGVVDEIYLENQWLSNVSLNIEANSVYRAVCIGINHNKDIEGNNRFHFAIAKDTYNTNIYFAGRKLNDTDTSDGGWEGCALRTWLNGTFYNALPAALKSVISPCTKYTNNVGANNLESSITATSDKIFLCASYEVNGEKDMDSNIYEHTKQQIYEWYANGNGLTPTLFIHGVSESSTSPNGVLTRSPANDTKGYFVTYITGYGSSNSTNEGFIPCFTIA